MVIYCPIDLSVIMFFIKSKTISILFLLHDLTAINQLVKHVKNIEKYESISIF